MRQWLLFTLFSMASVGHGFDRGGILRGGHACYFLKLSRKVVNRGIAQLLGNLCKIHLACTNQLLGGLNFHLREIFYDAKTGFLAEQLL